jgi:adenine-specific DNA-methyltransferase
LRDASTDAERVLWQRLRNRQLSGYKFRRQHVIGAYVADFVCLEHHLIVELDGGQHVELAAVDAVRTAFLQATVFRVLRYWNDEVLLRLDDVLADVLRELERHPLPNPLPPAGEGDEQSALESRSAEAPEARALSPLPLAGEG